jgi:DNA-binding transcriptional MerR regulator
MSASTGPDDPAAKAPHVITEVARSAGVSSRTLRHYEAVGLLPATAVGAGGLRRYDDRALVRLQRILLLRGLGLGLPEIRRVLDGEQDDVAALTAHVAWLEQERDRLARQLAAVRTTITRIEQGDDMNATDTFDGFDQNRFKHEVEERWGTDAGQRGAAWWAAQDAGSRRAFQDEQHAIAQDAAALAASGDAARSSAGRPWLGGSSPGSRGRRRQPSSTRNDSAPWRRCTCRTSGSLASTTEPGWVQRRRSGTRWSPWPTAACRWIGHDRGRSR